MLGATGLSVPLVNATEQPALALGQGKGVVREYWLQADSFQHNLVPTGSDQMMGMMFEPSQSTYWAVGYRAYTAGWGRPLPGDEFIGANAGIPGPTIRAAVGDTVMIHFRNNDTHYRWPHSLHTHGFRYTPANDGAYVAARPNDTGAAVAPGGTYTYTWTAVESSVGTWLYHDHSIAQGTGKMGPVMEMGAQLGLFGAVAITDRRTAPVDRELVLFLHDLYADEVPGLSQDFDCFNGAAYLGNTPTFVARHGQRVRWRVAALGKEFHVFHLHGHRWRDPSGRFVDSQILGPSTTLTIEYTEDNPGDWLYHCHVTDHMAGGMVGWYKVT
jgi:FtsP/CotA-like multicopper oxidase with cupredoxin domain